MSKRMINILIPTNEVCLEDKVTREQISLGIMIFNSRDQERVQQSKLKLNTMIDQEIFGNVFNTKEDNRVTYCDLLDDDHYVSQFLNVDDLNLDVHQEISQEAVEELLQQMPTEQVKQAREQLVQISKPHKKRSSFHNFQKHLVTTIRSIIDTSKLGQDQETAQCEKKIWKVFMNSNKINKTLVSVTVGDLTSEESSKIAQYGFKDIMREFNPAQIKQAQQNIHEQVLKQLHLANLEQELTKRRMKHKKQFVVYFQAFLQELENGELDKRMAKCTKLLKNQYL